MKSNPFWGYIILATWIAIALVAIVAGFSYMGLFQTSGTSAGLHVPIFSLPSGCTASLASSMLTSSSSSAPPPLFAMGGNGVATVMSACASFAVIAANESQSAFPLLLKLQKVYPLSHYSTHTIPALAEPPSAAAQMATYASNVLRKAVVDLDAIVGQLVQRRVSLIHLPSTSSLLLDAFIRGSFQYRDAQGHMQTLQFFNGRTLAQRYPGQRFSVSETYASIVDNAPNILRFADVATQFDPALLLPKLAALGIVGDAPNSAIYMVNQQGDLASMEIFARLAALLTGGRAPILAGGSAALFSRNLTFTGTTASGSFSDAEVEAMAQNIDATVASLSLNGLARLVIVLNPASHLAAQTAFAAALDKVLGRYANDDRIRILGLTFAPKAGVFGAAFPIVRGLQAVALRPTPDLASIGFAEDAATLHLQVKGGDLAVLDALKFAAQCRTVDTQAAASAVTGSPYKFIRGTIVSELLHDDGVIAPATMMPASLDSGLRFNGRFSGRGAVNGA